MHDLGTIIRMNKAKPYRVVKEVNRGKPLDVLIQDAYNKGYEDAKSGAEKNEQS